MSTLRTLRLSINYHYFNAHPVRAIKQLIGQNATLISYKVNSVVSWDGNVIVDIVYKSIPIDQFSIYYVKQSDIRHLIPNSEKYVVVVNGCNVKLNNPKLSQFHEWLPIRIKKTIINDTDAYEDYYAQSITDSSLNELKTNNGGLVNYFGTTVTNPMNSLITPLNTSLITSQITNDGSNGSNESESGYGFNITLPDKLYPDNFKPKDSYTLDETVKYYRQVAQSIPATSIIQDIKVINDNKLPESNTMETTGYIINANLLNNELKGIILIQPKRICELILYYPTNAYTISNAEVESIKKFIEMDRINYNNFMYIRNQN